MSKPNLKTKIFKMLILSLLVIANIFASQNRSVAVYKLVKLTEMALFAWWIKNYYSTWRGVARGGGPHRRGLPPPYQILSLSVLWQSILAIAQWFNQGSIFGFWFFGEQPFDSSTIGIKKISFFGQLKVVPMGTFPHPNMLAAFLLISLLFLLPFLLKLQNLPYKTSGRGSSMVKSLLFLSIKYSTIRKYLTISYFAIFIISVILGVITLFLTFSFPTWLVFAFFLSFLVTKAAGKTHKRLLISLICLISLIWLITRGSLWNPTSFARRKTLNQITLKMFLDHPFFGVGLNNFIPNMEKYGQVIANYRFLQPVHNVYLLVLAETGIIGLICLIGLIWLMLKNLWRKKQSNLLLLYTFCSILLLSLFDHYFFTIQQGMLMVTLILALNLF